MTSPCRGKNKNREMASGRTRTRRRVIQRIGELAHERDQPVDVTDFPRLKDGAPNPLARSINKVSHRVAFGGYHRLAHAPVGNTAVTLHQPKALELCDLTADGRVVAACAIRQVHHTDWP